MGQGYIRQDTGNNIADQEVIDPDVLDNEFNAIVTAFSSTSGHTHDGTTAEGAPITKVGPGQDIVVSVSSILPKTTNTMDLGSSSLTFKQIYAEKHTVGELQASTMLGTVSTLSTTTPTVDCSTGDYFTLTTAGNTTFTFDYSSITLTTDDTYCMVIEVTASGSHTLTWPASVEWPLGVAAPSPASGETSLYVFITRDGGTTWRANRFGGAFA